jgi:uncharacterized secreted protein with C-terminal beta-propeller domain
VRPRVLAAGDTVYASAERLYVATTRWADWDGCPSANGTNAAETDHRAARLRRLRPAHGDYLGSGEVRGTLLSQWAMSEHDGHLRVASTVGDPWDRADAPSESVVTVLEVGEDELVEVGQVTGLGPDRTIHAVRFIGDVGYVVTFRQTDPLYTLDLRDPTDPQVTGELKIRATPPTCTRSATTCCWASARTPTRQGETKGMQLSLFDVSDPAAPTLLDQVDLTDSYSDVEYDHRAFLHWPATG